MRELLDDLAPGIEIGSDKVQCIILFLLTFCYPKTIILMSIVNKAALLYMLQSRL